MTEPTTTEPTTLAVSMVIKMEPLTGRNVTSAQDYAYQLTVYLAKQLENFADQRGGDVFLAVVVDRGEERGSHQYRSGHFVSPEGTPYPPTKEMIP